MGELENRCKLAVMVLQELSREISRQKTEKAQEELTMATQLYCCVHKVPVCGECICRPEHSTCAVRAYSDWIVDGSDILSPKCSLCFQNFSKSSDSVTRLSCLHVLHTSCLLLHLKRSSSPRGYTCPSCNSQIWPPKQQFVSSGSTLYKQIEKVVEKSYITMLDKNFDALSPLASELSPNLSNSSVASGQGISGPAISPRMVVLSSSAPLGELYKNQTAQKLMQQNFILSERNLQTEIDERNSTASAMIDIEASNPSSPEIISTKTVGSPKHKVLSRKCSFRGDKRITDYPTGECGKGSTCIHKGFQIEQGDFLSLCSPPTKYILPITSPMYKNISGSECVQDAVDGRWRRYSRVTSLDPRKILFFFATLSSMGTMILIYLTLTVRKIGEGLVHVEVQ